MALPILDGNQSATTLSSILTGGEHIPAHTVVSLGTQAITDISGAVSGSVVSISNFPATQTIAGTVTANVFGKDPQGSDLYQIPVISYDEGVEPNGLVVPVQITNGGGTLNYNNPLPISGTVTANLASNLIASQVESGIVAYASDLANDPLPISGTVTIGNTVTIAGTVTADAGSGFPGVIYSGILQYIDTEGPIPIAISSGTVTANLSKGDTGGNPLFSYIVDPNNDLVFASDYPFPIAGTVTVGSLPAISGTVTANTFALQGTTVTTSDFTSTTASTLLAGFNAGREVLTIFNEGAGNLHICAGATCTTIAYQVRLSAGDYYEVPNHQTTITHSAVFATAGTARVTQVS